MALTRWTSGAGFAYRDGIVVHTKALDRFLAYFVHCTIVQIDLATSKSTEDMPARGGLSRCVTHRQQVRSVANIKQCIC